LAAAAAIIARSVPTTIIAYHMPRSMPLPPFPVPNLRRSCSRPFACPAMPPDQRNLVCVSPSIYSTMPYPRW
jgi:hypothetical protein